MTSCCLMSCSNILLQQETSNQGINIIETAVKSEFEHLWIVFLNVVKLQIIFSKSNHPIINHK